MERGVGKEGCNGLGGWEGDREVTQESEGQKIYFFYLMMLLMFFK